MLLGKFVTPSTNKKAPATAEAMSFSSIDLVRREHSCRTHLAAREGNWSTKIRYFELEILNHLKMVRMDGLEPSCLRTRPSNVRVYQNGRATTPSDWLFRPWFWVKK